MSCPASVTRFSSASLRASSAANCCSSRADEALARLVRDLGDDVLREVQHLLEDAGRDVEQQTDPAWRAFDEPDVTDRRRQLDVAHSLAAHLGPSNSDTTLVANDALVADAFVLTARALPILGGAEDTLAE